MLADLKLLFSLLWCVAALHFSLFQRTYAMIRLLCLSVCFSYFASMPSPPSAGGGGGAGAGGPSATSSGGGSSAGAVGSPGGPSATSGGGSGAGAVGSPGGRSATSAGGSGVGVVGSSGGVYDLGLVAVSIMYRNVVVDPEDAAIKELVKLVTLHGWASRALPFWLTVSQRPPPDGVVRRLACALGLVLEPRQFGFGSTGELVDQLESVVEWYRVSRGREGAGDEVAHIVGSLPSTSASASVQHVPRDAGGGAGDTDGVREALRTCCNCPVVLVGLLNNQLLPVGFPKGL